jgi:hypothetical protein
MNRESVLEGWHSRATKVNLRFLVTLPNVGLVVSRRALFWGQVRLSDVVIGLSAQDPKANKWASTSKAAEVPSSSDAVCSASEFPLGADGRAIRFLRPEVV